MQIQITQVASDQIKERKPKECSVLFRLRDKHLKSLSTHIHTKFLLFSISRRQKGKKKNYLNLLALMGNRMRLKTS